jgi:hypothetical protein
MQVRAFAICFLANILVSGVLSLPPLQLDPQVGRIPDRSVKRSSRIPSTRARLPSAIIPSHYKVDLTPLIDPDDEENFLKAPGHVTITVECVEATSTIVLNSVDITIATGDVKVCAHILQYF